MKHVNVWLAMLLGSLALLGALPASAVEDDAAAQQEIQQQQETIDQTAATAQGAATIEQNIMDQFVVDESVIETLREKQFGYGEIVTTLSLAERMEGGINESNIQSIVDLRNSSPKKGWGEIAKQFNVNVGDLKKGLQAAGDLPRSGNDAAAKQNIQAALGADNKSSAKNNDILPVTKNLPNAAAGKPAQVPKGK